MEEETEKSSDKTRGNDGFELKISKTKDGTEKYVVLFLIGTSLFAKCCVRYVLSSVLC